MLLKYRGGEGESCSVINDADRVVSRIRTGEVPYKAVNTPVFLGGRYLRDGATSQNKHIISQGPFLLTYYNVRGPMNSVESVRPNVSSPFLTDETVVE